MTPDNVAAWLSDLAGVDVEAVKPLLGAVAGLVVVCLWKMARRWMLKDLGYGKPPSPLAKMVLKLLDDPKTKWDTYTNGMSRPVEMWLWMPVKIALRDPEVEITNRLTHAERKEILQKGRKIWYRIEEEKLQQQLARAAKDKP